VVTHVQTLQRQVGVLVQRLLILLLDAGASIHALPRWSVGTRKITRNNNTAKKLQGLHFSRDFIVMEFYPCGAIPVVILWFYHFSFPRSSVVTHVQTLQRQVGVLVQRLLILLLDAGASIHALPRWSVGTRKMILRASIDSLLLCFYPTRIPSAIHLLPYLKL
jgi:hypothetical protein